MVLRKVIQAGSVVLAIGLAALPAVAQQAPRSAVDEVRRELLQLPYYGVFDFLSFKMDNGTVTLMGYAYHGSLKKDAERAVKRAPGVTAVTNEIEELPVSFTDDDLRWSVYYKIYRDPFLSRYAPGGGLLWGHRHPFAGGRFFPLGPARFPGTEPAGDYPIHIIVKNGRVLLLGVVDSKADKITAGLRAREVPGSFAVENEIVVERPASTGTK